MKDSAPYVSAPGRVMLFGDHAVNFGQPAIALAVDYRVSCKVQHSPRFTVNEEELDPRRHPSIRAALLQGWTNMDQPLSFTIESGLPEGLDLGQQSATTVACLGAISMLHDHMIFEEVARNAFEVGREAEGRTNALDPSVSTHGGGVFLARKPGEDYLWSLRSEGIEWHTHDLAIPEMDLMLACLKDPGDLEDTGAKIQRFHQRNSFARDMISDIGRLVPEALEAMKSGDLAEIGRLMNSNQKLLMNLGAGHPGIEQLASAAARHSHGVKITGHGGDCILILAKEPESVMSSVEEAGGKAFPIKLARDGLRLED